MNKRTVALISLVVSIIVCTAERYGLPVHGVHAAPAPEAPKQCA